MPGDRSISGTYRFREKLFVVVTNPDGMRWAFTEDGEEASAADVTRKGERLSANIPQWALDFAKEAREAWDAVGDKMKRLERDK